MELREEEKKDSGKRNSRTVNLTPFTPFKSPFSSESSVKITLWLRLWSWKKTQIRTKSKTVRWRALWMGWTGQKDAKGL